MPQCEKEELNLLKVGLGIVVTTVLVVSYLPQIVKLLKTKNSFGISTYAQVLSFSAQTLTLLNIFLLQQKEIDCCVSGNYGVSYCLGNLIGVIQVFIQWCCITTILCLFVKYFPINVNQEYTAIGIEGEILMREWKIIVKIIYILISVFIILVLLVLIAIFMNWEDSSKEKLALVFGLGSTLFSLVQFLPQIAETYKNKSVGALSIPSMLIQCPGSFVLVIFLAIQPGTNWTTWFTYFVGGTLQGILLFLCIYYTIKNKNRSPPDEIYESDNENSNV